jgi:hypothetical protein
VHRTADRRLSRRCRCFDGEVGVRGEQVKKGDGCLQLHGRYGYAAHALLRGKCIRDEARPKLRPSSRNPRSLV